MAAAGRPLVAALVADDHTRGRGLRLARRAAPVTANLSLCKACADLRTKWQLWCSGHLKSVGGTLSDFY